MTKREAEFLIELITFFKYSICGTANSIRTLTTLEEKFKPEYDELRKSKLDPAQIDKLLEKMPQKEKDVFFMIFAKATYIVPKINKLFDLNLEEKKELSETIDNFAKFVEDKLTELIKDREGH